MREEIQNLKFLRLRKIHANVSEPSLCLNLSFSNLSACIYTTKSDQTPHKSPKTKTPNKQGSDFSVMGMHFKLGLYEHQSAGAIQGILNLVEQNPSLRGYGEERARLGVDKIARIRIKAYEPAFGIIGDPAKRDPTTRQSADHSMCYIISRLLSKAFRLPEGTKFETPEDPWKHLMLLPYDYSKEAIYDPLTRAIMEKVEFEHGGEEYDKNYPDGIPTSLTIEARDIGTSMGSLGGPRTNLDSGFIMYPGGQARNTTVNLDNVLAHKFKSLAALCVKEGDSAAATALIDRFQAIDKLDNSGLRALHDFDIVHRNNFVDA